MKHKPLPAYPWDWAKFHKWKNKVCMPATYWTPPIVTTGGSGGASR